MKYLEIIARQEAIEGEMHERQAELQELQSKRIALAGTHEDLNVISTLSSGTTIGINLNYEHGDTAIFKMHDSESMAHFSVEDYNEMSQFFSKYNDAILSYMTEKTKVEEDVTED